jgi:hypothetical protein
MNSSKISSRRRAGWRGYHVVSLMLAKPRRPSLAPAADPQTSTLHHHLDDEPSGGFPPRPPYHAGSHLVSVSPFDSFTDLSG